MKNEKLCFDKKVGVIIFIGILFFLGISISSILLKTQTSTNSRATSATLQRQNTSQAWLITPVPLNDIERKNLPFLRSNSFTRYENFVNSIGCGYISDFNQKDAYLKNIFLYKDCRTTEMCSSVLKDRKSECININDLKKDVEDSELFSITLQQRVEGGGTLTVKPDSSGIFRLSQDDLNQYEIYTILGLGATSYFPISVKSIVQVEVDKVIAKTYEKSIANSKDRKVDFGEFQVNATIDPVAMNNILLKEGTHEILLTVSMSDSHLGDYKYTQKKIFTVLIEKAFQGR